VFNEDLWQNPYAFTAPVREQHPCARVEPFGVWVVLRYADVRGLMADSRLTGYYGDDFVIPEGPLRRLTAGLLGSQEGAKHARLRALIIHAFTPKRVDEQRPFLRELARARLAVLRDGETLDIQTTVADELPVRVLCRMVGIPEQDIEQFGRWSGNIASHAISLTGEQQKAIDAAEHLHDYCVELIERRRHAPGDDLLDALIAAEEAGEKLTDDELVDTLMNLFVAGHDTTRSMLAMTVLRLALHRDQLALLRADPRLVPRAVEEVLRYESPLMIVPRVTRAPVRIGGIDFATGERVALCLFTANHDPRAFPDPLRFDIRRHGEQLALGHGIHFCVGAHLARAEASELIHILTELPDLELVTPPRWVPFAALSRRLEALPVRAVHR
jgi:6-deoxyerythronolide B hydroxylase